MKKTRFLISLFFTGVAMMFFATTAKGANQINHMTKDVSLPVDTLSNEIVAFSDDIETLESWREVVESITGCEMLCFDFNGVDGRSREAVDTFIRKNNLKEVKPKAVFLQIGCKGEADSESDYEKVLFDFPTGNVCTLTGKNLRNKRIAVSKPDDAIDASNFAGSLYLMMRTIRKAYWGAHVFILPPVKAGETADDERCKQLSMVANMFSVPFVECVSQLAEHRYYWTGEKPEIGKLLILGDSYSEQKRWIRQLADMSNVEVLNLGVSSATIRDRYNDKTKYPYSSNPVSSDNEGNHNTISSQINKLKRLMNGTLLYQGEKSLEGYVPDVIIIEGGSNDNPDAPQAVEGYAEDIRQDRRITFAGALGYHTRELRKMFPDARIFVTTTAGLYYGHTDRPFDFIVKSEQQRKAAKMLGVPVINWDLDGRLSFVFNNSAGTGDGSESKPFRYNVESKETVDLLHPNEYGARFLAESVLRWMTAGENK